jgi:hypothetical protein
MSIKSLLNAALNHIGSAAGKPVTSSVVELKGLTLKTDSYYLCGSYKAPANGFICVQSFAFELADDVSGEGFFDVAISGTQFGGSSSIPNDPYSLYKDCCGYVTIPVQKGDTVLVYICNVYPSIYFFYDNGSKQ